MLACHHILRSDSSRHVCTGTGASPPTSAPGLGLALHTGTGTYLRTEHCAWREAAQPVACRRRVSHATCRVVRREPCVITVCVPRPRCGAVQHEGARRTRAARGSLLPNAGGARLPPRACIPAGMVGRALPSRHCWLMCARTQTRLDAPKHAGAHTHGSPPRIGRRGESWAPHSRWVWA